MNGGRRVVITGCGVVSSLGNTPEELYSRLVAGESAVRIMTEWGTGQAAAPVDLPESEVRSIPRSKRRFMGRVAILSALAGRKAAESAGLSEEEVHSERTGCVVGSTIGSTTEMESSFRTLLVGAGIADMSPMAFFKCASHTTAFNMASLLDIAGAVYSPSAACASGLQAAGIGMAMISSGIQDVVLCGGADEVSPLVSGCFELMEAHASAEGQPPDRIARPFERGRNGLVCGEGAGILVLEEYEHARARGARILAEIYSYSSCRCPGSVSQSDSSSILRCMRDVYRQVDFTPAETDYISAHATSTRQGDKAEADALRSVFGESVPVSSLKGHLGHTLAASGTLEIIAVLEMMKHGMLIPTRNLEEVDPECGGLDHVREPRPCRIRRVLKNCFAFGGINSAMLFGDVNE
ncbi:MAG: beta-ketoacyl-[acyl-carrier-protein] synthase family protein [Lentisphaeria bacterium]|nr:beta-ketoacyl-[acyl-carrier-protein] synthase family protein [Lentisphaeria bacterium]